MTRYITRVSSFWVEDDVFCEPVRRETPLVDEHVAINTGLLDQHGHKIWRQPNPIGFVWDEK
jgi:hypothetical protein